MPTAEKVSRTDTGLASELRMSVMRLRRRLANERDPHNELSIAVMAVLGALYRFGELTVGELAALERVQPPTMTRKVNLLEEGGFVSRRPHESDGRVVVVTLTQRGKDTVLADRLRTAPTRWPFVMRHVPTPPPGLDHTGWFGKPPPPP